MKKFIKDEKGSRKKEGLGESGQSEAVFRLMIDAVIGLAVLAIIITSISYFEYLRISSSNAEFNTKILAAINSPNGNVIESKNNLYFGKGSSYTSSQLQTLTTYPAQCFSFQSGLSSIVINPANPGSATMLSNVDAKLFVQCKSTGNTCTADYTTCCELECIVSFGKRID